VVMSSRPLGHSGQRGMVLILIAFIIGLGAAAFMYKMFNASNMHAAQDEKTMHVLGEAKAALIAWAVAHPNSPGMMPWPDRNTDLDFDGDSAYDGKSDCATGTFQPSYLLGQLPWRAQSNPCVTPHTGLGADFRDAQGNRLWYAVSRNLIRDYENSEYPIINPGMANPPHAVTPYLRQGGTDSYLWLKVLDRNGNLVSDRVAAVIISPGSPLEGQDRSSTAPDASQYLDSFQIGAAIFSNRGYATVDEDFIMGEDSRNVSSNDTSFNQPYYFNDKLVYITIDELMYALEKRVLQETRQVLESYYQSNTYYPFAAGYGLVANSNQCVQGNLRGLLPVNAPSTHVCSCTSARTCDCNFSVVSSIAFTRTSGNFVATGSASNAPTGACSVAASDRKTCTCTGAGSCKRASGAVQFSCNACGSCSATVAGVNRFVTTGSFSVSTGGCSNTTNLATCSNNTNGTFTLAACGASQVITSLPTVGGLLPAWYLQNEWQKYITYAVSSNCVSGSICSSASSPPKITVGVNNSVSALVATSLANPNVASCDISSYLSTVENTNVIVSNGKQDSVYSYTQPKTSTNTDQVVVVSP